MAALIAFGAFAEGDFVGAHRFALAVAKDEFAFAFINRDHAGFLLGLRSGADGVRCGVLRLGGGGYDRESEDEDVFQHS